MQMTLLVSLQTCVSIFGASGFTTRLSDVRILISRNGYWIFSCPIVGTPFILRQPKKKGRTETRPGKNIFWYQPTILNVLNPFKVENQDRFSVTERLTKMIQHYTNWWVTRDTGAGIQSISNCNCVITALWTLFVHSRDLRSQCTTFQKSCNTVTVQQCDGVLSYTLWAAHTNEKNLVSVKILWRSYLNVWVPVLIDWRCEDTVPSNKDIWKLDWTCREVYELLSNYSYRKCQVSYHVSSVNSPRIIDLRYRFLRCWSQANWRKAGQSKEGDIILFYSCRDSNPGPLVGYQT